MGDTTKILLFRAVLETIEKDGLKAVVQEVSQQLMKILGEASAAHPEYISNLRGVGTIIAFDCASPAKRDELATLLRNNGAFVGTNGTQSIRFRPALHFSLAHVSEFEDIFKMTLEQLAA